MANKAGQDQTPTVLPKDGVSRFGQIEAFLPFSRETWRKLVRDGKAPQPIKMGERCTVYRNADVHAWLADPVNYRAN
jgi:predicted DNA-binding transcriptional regulator AlpA